MTRESKNARSKSEVVASLPMACCDETAAVEFLERHRWGDTPTCAHCGSTEVYQMRSRDMKTRNKRFLWRCRACSKQYTVRVGTIYEESRIPLRHWCYAYWRACTSKKGVSALEIKRQTGLSYKSALFLMHRIRWAMAPANEKDANEGGKLNGTVEADETYVGGKPRFRKMQIPRWKRKDVPSNHQTMKDRKVPVFGAVQRDGRGRLRVLPSVNSHTLTAALKEHVDLSARLMTDESNVYTRVGREYTSHDQIEHKHYIYARGDVTTNRVEGLFSLVKRGIMGIWHNVSKEHLQRYLDAIEFRFSNRHLEDGERVVKLIKASVGRRLASGYKVLESKHD